MRRRATPVSNYHRPVGEKVAVASSPAMRDLDWRFTLFLREQENTSRMEVVGIGEWGQRPLGFAVDLGTTKTAAYLVDLETSADLAAAGAPNPNRLWRGRHQPPQSCLPQYGWRPCAGL